MKRVDVYLDVHKSWSTTLDEIIEEFPDEYKSDREEGLTDEQFVERTFNNMGENFWEEKFGWGRETSDLEIEIY